MNWNKLQKCEELEAIKACLKRDKQVLSMNQNQLIDRNLKLEKSLSELKKILWLWYWIQTNKRCKKIIWFINSWRLL